METLQQQLTSAESKSGFDVDVSFQMQALTLDIIARTSLGLNENVYEKNNQLLHSVREFFRLSNNIAVDLAMFFPFLKTVLTFINNNLTSLVYGLTKLIENQTNFLI